MTQEKVSETKQITKQVAVTLITAEKVMAIKAKKAEQGVPMTQPAIIAEAVNAYAEKVLSND
jgi:hypothetical protein